MPGPIESSVGTSDLDANDDLLKQVDRLCLEMEHLANQANAEKAAAVMAAATGGFPDPKDLHSQIDVLLAEAESSKKEVETPASPSANASDPSQDALLDQISNLAAQLAMEAAPEEPELHVEAVAVAPIAPAVEAPAPAVAVVSAAPVIVESPSVTVAVASEATSPATKTAGWFALNTLFLGVCVWGWLIFVRQPMMAQQESGSFDFKSGSVPSVVRPAPESSVAPKESHGEQPAKSEGHGASKPAKKDAHGGGH